MRWILLIVAIVAFAVAFTGGSPGLMGAGMVIGCGSLLGFALALVSARISQSAQSETALFVDPEINALRAKANLTRARSAATPARSAAPAQSDNADPPPTR